MSHTAPDDVLAALRGFVDRIDSLDPAAPRQGELTVRLGGVESRMTLRAPVAQALVDALRAYHDPRDQGGCDHCGYRRLDNNLLCLDCGLPNGLFGQLIAERVARHAEQTATPTTPFGRGRHAHDDGENGPPGSHLPVLPEAKSGS